MKWNFMRLKLKWRRKNGVDLNVIEVTYGYLLLLIALVMLGITSVVVF